ncbi:MAG: aldehyde dehydrogenase family protein [Pseudonocardiales bacterium]|nr:aldehyde dehydrogenase family protein [Pseudonocardiales bacterium]
MSAPDQRQVEHFIGGQWVASRRGQRLLVINPATEQSIATVPEATGQDIESAVAAARAAFPAWAATPPHERAGHLRRLAVRLEARTDEIARTITAEMGAPLAFSLRVQAGLPVTVMFSFADVTASFSFEEKIDNSLVILDPVGVVAAITPWNFPLHQVILKVAAALAAGCTVVVKPSELAPLSADLLAELAHDTGLPAGVLNIVHGTGPRVGEALTRHPGIDMVSFTGSTRAGREVARRAGETLKKVALELGGKSATVILPDTDSDLFETAVRHGVRKCFMNSGQSCNALTRLLVPADQTGTAVELAAAEAGRFAVGDPFADGVRIGPMVSAHHRDRVRGYIQQGVAEGAQLAIGGFEPPAGLDRGFYIRPTVFADVSPAMVVAQEEIFGPVLTVTGYHSEDQAVDIANGTPYGLAGAVWSADPDHAATFARRLRTGQVDLNGGRFNPLAPFGGFGHSGFGREYGSYGLREFCEPKSLQF